jgi:hypothetical protein
MKKLYGAFDLHSSNNYLGISDEKDRRVYKKRLPNQPDVILAELEPYRNDLVGLVVESTFTSNNIREKSTATTNTMPFGWLICCDSEYCRRAIFIQKRKDLSGICCAKEDTW